MFTLSYRITGSKMDTEDILQESFMSSFTKINELKESKQYFAWLKRIVLNNSLKAIKNKKYFDSLEMLHEVPEDIEDTKWYEKIPFSAIREAIDELPNGSKQIFTLYLIEGFKHKEIGEMLSISSSTSKSQYRYALRLLKNKFVNTI